MRLGIRAKLFLISLGLIALSVLVANARLTSEVEAQLTQRMRDDLHVRARLVAREVRAAPPSLDAAGWATTAREIGKAAAGRVTILGREGVVLGDSEIDPKDVASVESHAERPEVMEAMAKGEGESSRLSATLHRRYLYAAVRLEDGPGGATVARTAVPLTSVDEAIERVQAAIAVASLLAVAVAIFLSSVAAQRMSRVVRELTVTARRMSAGDLDARARLAGGDEMAELGAAFDQLATSLSQTLDALRAERDLQGSILDGMQEGVLVLDVDGRVVMMNPALRGMLLVGADTKGRLLIEVLRHAELHELMKRAREDSAEPVRGEIELPGIKPRRLLVHATALAVDAGGLLAVLVDVTDLRRLESLRRDFVANVSHELRTPVTAVRSAAETLRTSALRDPVAAARFVDIIDRNGERLQSLIEDLLELSRLESKEFRLHREPVDVDHVFRLVLGLFRERADKKGVRLVTRLDGKLGALETDQRALEQVLSNLVDNAIKYCPPGSEVRLEAREEGDGLLLTVTDTGPGIDAKHLPRLFERFYRVDAGRSRDVGGTGLGLSIVKHLVEALGGVVSVKSAVGKGCEFSVRLPEADEA